MTVYTIFLCFILWTFPASALSGDALDHARSAMRFTDRKDWSNATSQAKQSGDEVVAKLVEWQYLLDPDAKAGFDEFRHFLDENSEWPEQKKLHIRAELSLKDSHSADSDLIAWFGDTMPITGVGKLALAEAYKRSGQGTAQKIAYLIRDAWRNGDFDEAQEDRILDMYGKQLTREDHISRIDRLLWEGKPTAAKRILDLAPPDYRKLFKARIALINDKKLSVLAVAEVPSSLKKDPGLIYDRMMYRARRDDDSGVRDMLLNAPDHVPYPEKWWKQRELQVRKAIAERKYDLAKKLLANHGQVDGSEQADALWLQGWLECEFLDQPKAAYDLFYRMYDDVHFPSSRARAAYWAARAAEKSGDEQAAANWYNSASAYPTTFYGQLASLHHNGEAPLHLPAPPSVSNQEKSEFENSELAEAVRLCVELNEPELAKRFVTHMINDADNDKEAVLAAGLGKLTHQPQLGVHGAKKALQRNIVMVDVGYPLPKIPSGLAIERPLALAIIRQESEFDTHAHSPSGALGMMQLLSSTAREMARKHDMRFSKDRLYDPDYNIRLGSYYLARLINGYDGSYVMAIAAYNGGPGNVRSWMQTFGTPGNNLDAAVNWIEKIPFTETRNYVQRVLENLQVYRHLDADGDAPKLQIGADLVR